MIKQKILLLIFFLIFISFSGCTTEDKSVDKDSDGYNDDTDHFPDNPNFHLSELIAGEHSFLLEPGYTKETYLNSEHIEYFHVDEICKYVLLKWRVDINDSSDDCHNVTIDLGYVDSNEIEENITFIVGNAEGNFEYKYGDGIKYFGSPFGVGSEHWIRVTTQNWGMWKIHFYNPEKSCAVNMDYIIKTIR